MKNQWIEFLFGRVTVRVAGKGTERFINILIRNGLHIWDVKRHGTETITFKMRLQDALKMRKYARRSECDITFLQRSGAPFLLKRSLKNSGFIIGAAIFLFLILLLSNVVWGIEINGAKPATEHQIRKELDKMGVKVGKFQFFIDNVETIQKKLTNQIGALTWVGVELKGTTYHFQVVEKNQPKAPEVLSPRNLIAKKEATIVNYYVEKGKTVVDVHDHVKVGQLLVSGLIGKEGEEIPVAAKGEVWGETWYRSQVELPLKTKFYVFNGKEQQKHSILLGKWEIPIWGFWTPKFKEFETEENIHKIHFLKWDLPISMVNSTVREREEVVRTYGVQEAFKIAVELAKKNVIKNHLDEEASIKDEKILHKSIVDGKVKLEVLFIAVENIAKAQPIPKETQMNDGKAKNN
ncbi:MAG: sporulation protein YqfD [Bacillota bacterium]|nr:sporulation protein YqfD [Bacillota bacterium]